MWGKRGGGGVAEPRNKVRAAARSLRPARSRSEPGAAVSALSPAGLDPSPGVRTDGVLRGGACTPRTRRAQDKRDSALAVLPPAASENGVVGPERRDLNMAAGGTASGPAPAGPTPQDPPPQGPTALPPMVSPPRPRPAAPRPQRLRPPRPRLLLHRPVFRGPSVVGSFFSWPGCGIPQDRHPPAQRPGSLQRLQEKAEPDRNLRSAPA